MKKHMQLYGKIIIPAEQTKGLKKMLYLAGLNKVLFRRIYRSSDIRVDYGSNKEYAIQIRAKDKESYSRVISNLFEQFQEKNIQADLKEDI
jgi:hypothetical protein